MEWIHLAQDRDRWRAFVKAVMDILICSVFRALLNISVIYKQRTKCTPKFVMYFIHKFLTTCFGRHCCHLQDEIITRI